LAFPGHALNAGEVDLRSALVVVWMGYSRTVAAPVAGLHVADAGRLRKSAKSDCKRMHDNLSALLSLRLAFELSGILLS
jgi:hypothetical protein